MNPATLGRCEAALYLLVTLLLIVQVGQDLAAQLSTLL